MSEDTGLRFTLCHEMAQMRYGWNRMIDRDIARRAWPPTGDHDTSPEAFHRAMALAAGGNRPEESYTTIERIVNDLDDGSFDVREDPFGAIIVSRRGSSCPKCRGSKFVRKLKQNSLDEARVIQETMPTEMFRTHEVIDEECDCTPEDTER